MELKHTDMTSDLDYIFVTQNGATSEKESQISKFLDNMGVFQIHLSAVMHELK
jgi:hypothetical protein